MVVRLGVNALLCIVLPGVCIAASPEVATDAPTQMVSLLQVNANRIVSEATPKKDVVWHTRGNKSLEVHKMAAYHMMMNATCIMCEEAYARALATHSKQTLREYVSEVLDEAGLAVVDKKRFASMLKFYDGGCASQSFSALRKELLGGLKTGKCAPTPWIKRVDDPDLPRHSKKMAMLQGSVDSTIPVPTWEWRYYMEEQENHLQLLQSKKPAVQPSERRFSLMSSLIYCRASFFYLFSSMQNLVFGERTKTSAALAESAALDQSGYLAVLARKDRAAMHTYVQRVLENEHLRATSEGKLNGMLLFYDGTCASQSYGTLVQELRRTVNNTEKCYGPWIEKTD